MQRTLRAITILGKLLCRIGLHKGNVESLGKGWVAFDCVRCDKLVDPAPPEVTASLYLEDAKKYEKEGDDENAEWYRNRARELLTGESQGV